MRLKISNSLFVKLLYWVLIDAEWLDSSLVQKVLCNGKIRAHKVHFGTFFFLFSSLFFIEWTAHLLILLYNYREVLSIFRWSPRPHFAFLGSFNLWQPELRIFEDLLCDLLTLVPPCFLLEFKVLLIFVEEIVHSMLWLINRLVLGLGLSLKRVAIWHYWLELLLILLFFLLEFHDRMRLIGATVFTFRYLRYRICGIIYRYV